MPKTDWIEDLEEYVKLREEIGRLEEDGECSCDPDNFHRCQLCEDIGRLDDRARHLILLWGDTWAVKLYEKAHAPATPAQEDYWRYVAEQVFFHVLLRGGEGNPFRSIANKWFIELAAPKLQELLGRVAEAAPTADAQTLSDLLCPPHANLDKNGKLKDFDNCIACIQVHRDELISLLARISTDIAQTIIEDPIRAADGWAMLSTPVINDIQAALYPYQGAKSGLPSPPAGQGRDE